MRITFLSLLILSLSLSSLAQENKFSFEFDYARFNYDSVSTYLEIYYSIPQMELEKLQFEDSVEVSALLTIGIFDLVDQDTVIYKKYNSITKYPVVDEKSNQRLIGVLGYVIEPGNYEMIISVVDNNSGKQSNISELITIGDQVQDNLRISDIVLATRIITASQNVNSIFYKNTMEIFPNPNNVFGQNFPMLFYYAELYNIQSDTTSESLILNAQLLNSQGRKIFEKSKSIAKLNTNIVDVGAINISKYPSGTYTLNLNLLPLNSNLGIVSSKKFFIYNPGVEPDPEMIAADFTVLNTEFGVFSHEECDELFASAKYIAQPKEIDQYESLDSLDAKREFFFEFFKRRDPFPETPENEFKREFDERIKLVNNRYRTFTKKGFKTDRGRVFITYGEPDEIELYPNDYNRKPYEIWHFHSIEGGVQFVFGDLTGYSDYELLHSTKRGELRDDNWVRRITAN
jgi:GWxTD domain-containing protein